MMNNEPEKKIQAAVIIPSPQRLIQLKENLVKALNTNRIRLANEQEVRVQLDLREILGLIIMFENAYGAAAYCEQLITEKCTCGLASELQAGREDMRLPVKQEEPGALPGPGAEKLIKES